MYQKEKRQVFGKLTLIKISNNSMFSWKQKAVVHVLPFDTKIVHLNNFQFPGKKNVEN